MADRVLLIEEKKIGLDLSVDIPRPRRTGSAKLAELEAEVLDIQYFSLQLGQLRRTGAPRSRDIHA